MPHTDGIENIEAIDKIKNLSGISDKVKNNILGGNALTLMGNTHGSSN
jgi:hypothetical protein